MSEDFIYEGDKGIFLTSRAHLITPGDGSIEMAWAEKYIQPNPNYSWILGKYVEADRANSNRQRFSFEDLKANISSLNHAPLNVNHSDLIVGNVPASEIVFPVSDEGSSNPYVEALSVFWKTRFPVVADDVQKAHAEGTLFYSMETRPEQINCGECDQTFKYIARQDPSYCEHLNDMSASSDKNLINPDFRGNALIIPPARPGWKNAAVSEVSQLIETQLRQQEEAYEHVKETFGLDKKTAEDMMRILILMNKSL